MKPVLSLYKRQGPETARAGAAPMLVFAVPHAEPAALPLAVASTEWDWAAQAPPGRLPVSDPCDGDDDAPIAPSAPPPAPPLPPSPVAAPQAFLAADLRVLSDRCDVSVATARRYQAAAAAVHCGRRFADPQSADDVAAAVAVLDDGLRGHSAATEPSVRDPMDVPAVADSVARLLDTVGRGCGTSVASLLEHARVAPTGTALDSVLGGGLPPGLVVEFAGPPASCKTLTSLFLAATVAVTGHGVVWCSPGPLDAVALLRFVTHLVRTSQGPLSSAGAAPDCESAVAAALSRVHHCPVASLDPFVSPAGDHRAFRAALEGHMVTAGTRLVVVDQVALLARMTAQVNFVPQGSSRPQMLAAAVVGTVQFLKRSCEHLSLTALVLNESSAAPPIAGVQEPAAVRGEAGKDADRRDGQAPAELHTALGLAFFHAVNIRLRFTPETEAAAKRQRDAADVAVRWRIVVEKSPLSGDAAFVGRLEDPSTAAAVCVDSWP